MKERNLKTEGMQRAYSLFEIKGMSDDEDQYVIEGIATTPEPDRYGDIVEPKGANFKLPIPLLWQHKRDQPIGQVIDAKITDKGIYVKCQIAKIKEPGRLKDRLDEAWQSIKHGLVKAFSIGFDPTEYSQMKDTYSYHFLKWDWLELSAVTLPANADCDIQTVKSIDTETRAALGQTRSPVARRDTTAGASAKSTPPIKKETLMKTLQERIADFMAARQKCIDDITLITAKSVETGETISAEDAETLTGLEKSLQTLDTTINALKRSEALQVSKGVELDGAGGTTTVQRGSAVSLPAGARISVEAEKLEKGIAFARFVRCMAMAHGRASDAHEIAKAHYPQMAPLHNILKAAVAAGSTTDANFAGNLVEYNLYAADFIDYLRPQTIIGKFGQNGIPGLFEVPFNIEIIRQTSGGSGYWVGQGKPTPLTKFDFDRVQLGYTKLGNIAVLTKEQVRFSNPKADMLVRDAVAKALIAKSDSDFLNPSVAAVANVSPASLTNGLSAIQATGTDADAVRADLRVLMQTFVTANLALASGVFVMTAGRALSLSLMRNALGQKEFPDITMLGGRLEGLPVITSQYLPNSVSGGDMVVLMDASEVYLADDGQVTVDASDQVSLEMNDAPTQNSLAGTGASMVSMWQSGTIAMKAERYINWAKRRSAAVAYVDNCHWGE
jgi:HK97 family phage major capsid protein/HK97 family phage prohead protease